MVVFKELEMEGFKRYNSKKTYKFNEGLIGIFGKNESGKSTIGDAISVALFGLSSTTYKKADLVTWGRTNTKIRLDFETDIPYRVERNLGNKSRAVLKKENNGRWEVIANTIKNVDNQIQDILGLDYKSFKNSIFIGQNDLNSLSSLNRMDRQTIINRLSRYDELSKAESLIKEDLKEKRISLQMLEKEFEALDKVVTEKIEKHTKLEGLNEDFSKKNSLLKGKENDLDEIKHEIIISAELKKIHDVQEKINELNNRIIEKVGEISRIEGKESDKRTYQDRLKKLEHLNQELEKTVDEIRSIVSDIGTVESRKSEIKEFESLINEKVGEISRIEGKESDKKKYEEKLENLEHVDLNLKDKVEKVDRILLKIKENNITKDKAFGEIKGYNKTLDGIGTSIEEKYSEIQRIEGKEREIAGYQGELDKFSHHTPQLKNRIDGISGIISELSPLQRELDRINREKSEIGPLKDEKELQLNYDKYEDILDLEGKSDSINKDIEKLDGDIRLKKEQLGDLREEKGDLAEIENKYESGSSKAAMFMGSGIFISLLGVALGFLVNLLFLVVLFIGLIPLYKGYKDRNYFKDKLSQIKAKREFFGQLKQLELQKNEKKGEYDSFQRKLEKYKAMDRESLKRDHETYNNLKNNIDALKKLDNEKIALEGRIKDYTVDLREAYEELPDLYKQEIPLADSDLAKKLQSIYQEEDKEKSKYETSIGELEKQITRKPQFIGEIESLEIKKQGIENQIEEKEEELKEIIESEEELDLELKYTYESLPEHYRDEVPLDDDELDKKISKIYQDEDKEKNNYLTTIKGLDNEIRRKDEVIKEKEVLEADKTRVETEISQETEQLEKELEENYSKLPVHYRDEVPLDDHELDKKISKIYQTEDKEKNSYLTTIKGLDNEIRRKDEVIKEKEVLEADKTSVETEISQETEQLEKELEENYSKLPVHYRDKIPLDDHELDKKISKIYQDEDKEKSSLESTIEELDKEIIRKPTVTGEKEGLETDKEGYEDQISTLKVGLRDLTDVEDLEYDPLKHHQLETQEKALGGEISRCERVLGTLQGEINTLKKDTADLDEKVKELDGLSENRDELNFEYDVMDIAKNEIANTAKMLREQVMERTRKHVYFLLPKITSNKYRDVKITEDFKIKVYSPEKNEFESIDSLSGGAKDQVLFSLRLAFTNAILSGRSRSKGFSLFLDEFLGSFDQNRRDETLMMLKELKDDFRQIFLISHIDGMEGNVDQVIRTPEI